MKILFLTRRFYPEIGGVEKHVLRVSMELIQKGHGVCVVTEADTNVPTSLKLRGASKSPLQDKQKSKVKTEEEYQNIKIFRIPITTGESLKKFQIWAWLFKNMRLIKESEIIHCHDVFFWMLPFRVLFPTKKIFTTFHGYEGSESPGWKNVFHHRVAGLLSNGSLAIGDFHQKWYGVRPDAVSYGAADGRHKYKKDKMYQGDTTYDFCFVGRLSEDTGIMVYLEALKKLKDKGGSYSLIICGDGPQREAAEEYSKSNKLNVKFLGFVKNPEESLRAAKFAFVSRYLSIIEAMQAKKLVFAVYNNNIKKDYLNMSPFSTWIISEKDPKELAEKILLYLNNKDREKIMVDEAYEWAKLQTWDRLTGLYLKLWSKR